MPVVSPENYVSGPAQLVRPARVAQYGAIMTTKSPFALLVASTLLALACGDDESDDGGDTESGTAEDGGTGTGDDGTDNGTQTGDGGTTQTDGTEGTDTGGFDPSVLTEQRGCSDVTLYATDFVDTWLLLFATSDAPAQTAHDQGTTQELSYTLPDPAVTVELRRGELLSTGVCNDTPPEAEPDLVYIATAGSADLTVVPTGTPEPWEVPADASLLLQDLVLEDPSGNTITMDSYEFVDVYVGWFPG
jgi:hypothetical protein